MATPKLGQEIELVQPLHIEKITKDKIKNKIQQEGEESLKSQRSTIKSLDNGKPSFLNNPIIENTTKKVHDHAREDINKIHEDRNQDGKYRPNFHFHGEDYLFAKNSLFCLNEQNKFRLNLIKWMTHR